MYERIRHLHFIGIGGIGMSGIAELLLTMGYTITGSDVQENANIRRLLALGATVRIGHAAQHMSGADAVVFSSAVKADNPEMMAARAQRIPVVPRAEMLAELMRLKYGIAIAGTHGKTTTTSLVAALLAEAGMDPTIVNGGIVKSFGSNARLGQGEFLVTEADESDGSFLKLSPTIAIATNIDPEHLDHYGTFDAVRAAFRQFMEKIPFYGLAVLCHDHPETARLADALPDKRVVTYGFSDGSDYQAVDMVQDGIHARFRIRCRQPGEGPGEIRLALPGRHNVTNTLAAIAVARELAIPWGVITTALERFRGVQRRFDLVHDDGQQVVIDDYAHHPQEIAATLEAARAGYPARKLVAVFQPHRYSRVRDLYSGFAACFRAADHVFVSTIYPAGEAVPAGMDPLSIVKELARDVKRESGCAAQTLHFADDGWEESIRAVMPPEGGVVVFLGAGDVTQRSRRYAAVLVAAATSGDAGMR